MLPWLLMATSCATQTQCLPSASVESAKIPPPPKSLTMTPPDAGSYLIDLKGLRERQQKLLEDTTGWLNDVQQERANLPNK